MSAETGITGQMRSRHWFISRSLDATTCAVQMMSASLANSDGCSRNGPKSRIQLRWPWTPAEIPGTNVSSSRRIENTRNSSANRRNSGTLARESTSIASTPRAANIAWRWKRVNADPLVSIDSTADELRTITRPSTSSSIEEPRIR